MDLREVMAESIRGKQSEDNAKQALKELYKGGIILNYRQTVKGSPDDRNGIDFYFSIRVKGKQIEVPLQVKSSLTGIQAHQNYGSTIHAVNGQRKDILKQIEAVIYDYHQTLGTIQLPIRMDEEKVMTLKTENRTQVENNYKKFIILEEVNRDIDKNHVKELRKSIEEKNDTDTFPIIVNEKMEIIDGQHRFTALKELGLPIRYKVVPGASVDMIARINRNQKSWKVSDIIKNEAGKGNKNFQTLRADMQKHDLSASTILQFIFGMQSYNDKVRAGTLEYGNNESTALDKFLNEAKLFKNLPFGQHAKFYKAFSVLRDHPLYELNVMVHQASKYNSLLSPQTNWDGYLTNLVYLYNYNRSKKHTPINVRDFNI